MDLLQHWRHYLKDIHSPDSYIDWSFYYIISASLQRRVWTSSSISPIYPNLFIILVGKPSTGKGQVLKQVKKVLSHHLLRPRKLNEVQAHTIQQSIKAAEIEEEVNEGLKKMLNPPLLIPVAADCTTFESLVQEVALAVRTCPSLKVNLDGSIKKETYFHSSIAIILEELSDLLKEQKDRKILKYLLRAYDCQDFRYRTKHQGEDTLKNPCLNFIAGTVPKYIQECFYVGLMEDGFTSRTHMIYEEFPRHALYDIEEPSKEQEESLQQVLNRVLELNKLHGQVSLSPEAHEYARHWYEVEFKKTRNNMSERLEDYYGRTRLHMEKMFMAIHFADSNEMVIQLDTVLKGLDVLKKAELKMHLALDFGETNPLAKLAKRILEYVGQKEGKVNISHIRLEFWKDVKHGSFDIMEIMNHLLNETKQLKQGDAGMLSLTPLSEKYKLLASRQTIEINGKPRTTGEKVSNMLAKYGQEETPPPPLTPPN